MNQSGNNGRRNGQRPNPNQNRQNPGRQRPSASSAPPRPPMDPEERARYEAYVRRKRAEAERLRREEEERERIRKLRDKERRKKEARQNFRNFCGRFLVFLIVVVLLCAIVGGIFLYFFTRTPDKVEDTGKIAFLYGGKEVRTVDTADCVTEGGIYFCFNDLADYLGMAESGTADAMKFILPVTEAEPETADGVGNEESVIFRSGEYAVIINGQEVQMTLPGKLTLTEIWVPTTFIGEYMNNLSVSYNERRGEVLISRIQDELHSTEEETFYLDVSFRLKSTAPLPSVEENPLYGEIDFNTGEEDNSENTYDLNFQTDLSAYEAYMNPTGDLRDAFLILVNTKNHLTATDVPTDLMDVKFIYPNSNKKQLREYAVKALEALYQEMYAAGYYDMFVHSGFRTYEYQDYLFNHYTQQEMSSNPALTKEEAEKIVLTYSTRPGTSEHQTGLAVDMDTRGDFSTDFEFTPEYAWLQENAWKFGFILRFPKDKTDITTIQFEPWHYRYVGRHHAKKIHDLGVCLEEYIEMIEE